MKMVAVNQESYVLLSFTAVCFGLCIKSHPQIDSVPKVCSPIQRAFTLLSECKSKSSVTHYLLGSGGPVGPINNTANILFVSRKGSNRDTLKKPK